MRQERNDSFQGKITKEKEKKEQGLLESELFGNNSQLCHSAAEKCERNYLSEG